MKKWIIIIVLLVVAFMIYGSIKGKYNQMVSLAEDTGQGWAQVENQYQRRADLIPNLVNTVKGYADFEKETLTEVIEARARATSTEIKVDPSKLDARSIQKFQQAQSQLSGALSRLLVTVERYPDLKASTQFQQLQVQLEGTENRISTERKRFNDTVLIYNKFIKLFPNNLFAGWFSFDEKAYFESKEGAENAPEVDFE